MALKLNLFNASCDTLTRELLARSIAAGVIDVSAFSFVGDPAIYMSRVLRTLMDDDCVRCEHDHHDPESDDYRDADESA